MSPHRANFLIYTIALILCLTSISVLVMGFAPSEGVSHVRDFSDAMDAKSSIKERRETYDIPSLKEFKKVWDIPLQRPLVDPPKVVPKPKPSTPKPRLIMNLHGLIVEPGHSRAIISLKDKQTQLASVGNVFWQGRHKIEIKTISENEMTVDYEGELIVMELIKDKHDEKRP